MTRFYDEQHAFDAGRFVGHLTANGVEATAEMDDIEYTPVVRIDIEGQAPVWVRVQPRDL